jgi:hypothetical protein
MHKTILKLYDQKKLVMGISWNISNDTSQLILQYMELKSKKAMVFRWALISPKEKFQSFQEFKKWFLIIISQENRGKNAF